MGTRGVRPEPPSGRWAVGLLVLAAVSGAVGWTVRGPVRPHPAVVPAGPTGGGWEGLLRGVPLNLNRATPEDLTAVPGIGPVRAAQIVAERDRRGGFGSVDELVEVRGIGPKTLAAVRPYLCLPSP